MEKKACRTAAVEFEERTRKESVSYPLNVFARMCCASYETTPKERKIGDFALESSLNLDPGLQRICIYKYRSHSVLVIKGTGTLDELKFDVTEIVANTQSRIFGILLKLIRVCIDHNICAVTGHSLGGFFSSLLSSWLSLPGVAFQAPGVPESVRGANHPERGFQIISFQKDIIGNYNNYDGFGHAPFQTAFLDCLLRDGFPLTKHHSIEEMTAFLESHKKLKDLTNFSGKELKKLGCFPSPAPENDLFRNLNAVVQKGTQIYETEVHQKLDFAPGEAETVKNFTTALRTGMNALENIAIYYSSCTTTTSSACSSSLVKQKKRKRTAENDDGEAEDEEDTTVAERDRRKMARTLDSVIECTNVAVTIASLFA